MKALVTRPQPDADRFATMCMAHGVEPVIAPLMSVEFCDDWETPKETGAFAFTSANGVRAFARARRIRTLPAFCVGEATAEAAREVQFLAIHTANGDVASLAALIARHTGAFKGPVAHIAGDRLAGDLVGALQQESVSAVQLCAYKARAVDALPETARNALGGGRALAVTLFSPRTAQLFLTLVERANMTEALARCRAVCLSDAVARAASGASWRVIDTAPARTVDSMIAIMKSGA